MADQNEQSTMPEITEVRFRRHVNTGNYESFEIEATAYIGEGVDRASAHNKALHLQGYVDQLCNGRLEALRRPGRRGGHDAGEDADDELEKALGL